MTTKNTNKLKSKTKSKVLVLGLILIILVGIWGPINKVRAQTTDPKDPKGVCTYKYNSEYQTGQNWAQSKCEDLKNKNKRDQGYEYISFAADSTGTSNDPATPVAGTELGTCTYNGETTPGIPKADCDFAGGKWAATTTAPSPSDFEKAMASRSCVSWGGADIPWCFVKVADLVFHTVPAFLLAKTAYFFNILIFVTLNGDVFKQDFVPQAWAIVRDLSNLFFILILLYIAIQIILGIGGSNVKKMITTVILTALLINFSMFFTGVVIDSSNILALVFYNKLEVNTKNADGKIRDYPAIDKEVDAAGGMVNAFDPTKILNGDFFKETAKVYYTDPKTGSTTGYTVEEVPAGTMFALILISGLIMCFAIYALFISGLSFLGRLIELWILIIFSPFAVMSIPVPILSGVDYIGWKAWFSRLLKVAFMAPIFMFFLYFIFLLIKSNIFKEIVKPVPSIINDPAAATKMLLGVVMPAIFICILLLQATRFAKKGSGAFGEALTKFGGKIGGLAVGMAGGAALGGAAIAGRATVGRAGAYFANTKLAQKWEAHGFGGEYARRGLSAVGSGSFDVRGVKIAGKNLAGATGLNLGEAQKGGFTARRKADVERRQKRAEDLKVKEDQPEKQAVNKAEADLQDLLNQVTGDFERIDKDLVAARQRKADATTGSVEELNAIADINRLNTQKGLIKDGSMGPTVASGPNAGKSIRDMEKDVIPDVKNKLTQENIKMMRTYANTTESGLGRVKDFIFSGGQSSYKGAREAAHKIRMGAKIEEKK